MRRISFDHFALFFVSRCFPHLLTMDWSLSFCFGLFLSHLDSGHILRLRISRFVFSVQLACLVCFRVIF